MSFTIKVKEEIIAASSKDKAELSALIKMSGSVGLTNQGLTLSISTENAKIARHIYQLMESRYQSNPELRHHNKTNLKKNRVYTVFVADHVNDILSDLQLADSFFGFETGIETSVMEDDEAGRSYLRGAFLATGTVRDPEKGRYQLEIFSVYQDHAEDLASLMKKFMLDAKVLSHKNGFVTYLQKAEDIMANGTNRRAHTSARQAKKNPDFKNAEPTIVSTHKGITKGEMKEIEAARVRKLREEGHKLPLNREKDKRYKPNKGGH